MRVVFLSNYFTPHQRGFSDALYEATGGNYTFVATVPPEQDRRDLGWDVDDVPAYVLNRPNLPSAELTSLILGADALITGSAPEESENQGQEARVSVFGAATKARPRAPQGTCALCQVAQDEPIAVANLSALSRRVCC